MSTLCHRSSSRKVQRLGQQPYDKYKTARPSHRSKVCTQHSTAKHPPSAAIADDPASSRSSSSASPGLRPPSTVRDVALQHIRKRYPKFQPQNDYDIVALSGSRYRGPESGVYTWLDGELARQLAVLGSIEGVIQMAEEMLSSTDQVTGQKPSLDTPNVFVRSIPHSPYAFRLFPGSLSAREFCLDFVHERSGQPVNSPFAFELWAVSPDGVGFARIRSLERAWGYTQEKIAPGEEKFVLRDGMTCILRRPGHKDLRFTVPTRPNPDVTSTPSDIDVVDLPRSIN